jgi:UDP-glucose 4-epimerase
MYDVELDLISNITPLIRFFKGWEKKRTLKKFIYISSGGTIYGDSLLSEPIREDYYKNPKSSYGLTKLVAEEYVSFFLNTFSLNGFILRPSNVYGEYQNLRNPQGIIGHAFNSILNKKPLILYGDGGVVRDFLYVADLVELIYQCLESSTEFVQQLTINAGSGIGYSIAEVIREISIVAGSELQVVKEPERSFDCRYNVLNIEKAKTIFSWEPGINLQQGLHKVWNWIKAIHDV